MKRRIQKSNRTGQMSRGKFRGSKFTLWSAAVAAAFLLGGLLGYVQFSHMPPAAAQTATARQEKTTAPMEAPAEAPSVPSSFKEMTPESRRSRVPVIMYHDVTKKKDVSYDVPPKKFRAQMESIKEAGFTPISMDQLYAHLTENKPLPAKPILLTFDDGYLGNYEEAYPILKEFKYPAIFFIVPAYVGVKTSKDHVTWDQLKKVVKDGLVTVEAHTMTHPVDLTKLEDAQLHRELFEAKAVLEKKLGITTNYLAYPTGNRDERVVALAKEAGYRMAFTMGEGYAGESTDILQLNRFGQSNLKLALAKGTGAEDSDLSISRPPVNFEAKLSYLSVTVDKVELSMAVGGRPLTFHGEGRNSLEDYLAKNPGTQAAVNGGFFPLRTREPAKMIGPILSANIGAFEPIIPAESGGLAGRPLVIISPKAFVVAPFNKGYLNAPEGIQSLVPDATDVFLGGAWLVRDGQGQSKEQMDKVIDSWGQTRHRSYMGMMGDGRFVAGITHNRTNAIDLAQALVKAGVQDAVLLDSGASTSLVYRGQRLTAYEPRPVPHAILIQTKEPTVVVDNPDLPIARGRP
jgi:poly-beta-1,6-N-acetyl-D-glucosamine N-deacetylase